MAAVRGGGRGRAATRQEASDRQSPALIVAPGCKHSVPAGPGGPALKIRDLLDEWGLDRRKRMETEG